MAKYMLRRGISRLPIDGIHEIQREGLPPLRQSWTVLFEAGKVVDTDLDFGPWVEDGTLVRIREQGDPPRPPKAAPVPEPKREILMPMPSFVQAEVVKEEAPAAVVEETVVQAQTEEPVSDGNTPVETPRPRRRR